MICKDFNLPSGKRRSIMSFNAAQDTRMLIDLAGVNYQYRHSKAEQQAVSDRFGFWDSTSPNPNVFVDADTNDIVPKPEDFIGVPFRLISATIVAPKTWRATDFSKPGVLKASTKKLDRKPVYENHNSTDLTNWVGIVNSPKWVEATVQDGVPIPAGIDGVIAIDAKTSPKLLRGVLSGIVFSNSVTVVFDWEPSHDFETPERFQQALGTMVEGTMVRRIVTKIHDYYESSLVFLGADPYAKLRGEDGKLVHVDKVAIMSNSALAQEPETVRAKYENENYYEVSCALDESVLLLSRKSVLSTSASSNANENNMNEQVEAALRLLLNLAADAPITEAHVASLSLTAPNIAEDVVLSKEQWEAVRPDASLEKPDAEFFQNFQFVRRDALSALTTERDSLASDKIALEAKVGDLQAAADYGLAVLEDQRTEAIRLYRVAVGEKADESVVALFQKADAPALKGLIAQYGQEVLGAFSGTCKDCGGHSISFQSSQGGGNDTVPTDSAQSFSLEGVRSKFINKNTKFLSGARRK